jgi:hypothetical protein
MANWLQALQESGFSQWCQSSAYPVVITLHSIGLAISVGLLTLIDLRVLGFVESLPLAAMRRYMSVIWCAFVLNAATGLMLFSIDAEKHFYSSVFRIKLLSITIGLCLAWLIQRRVLGQPAALSGARVLAVTSLLVWAIAIVSGRLLAYQ